jgi:DNA topoisomerase-2
MILFALSSTVEQIYQKKTPLEHILLRPDTYIGSTETVSQPMWVFDDAAEKMVNRFYCKRLHS